MKEGGRGTFTGQQPNKKRKGPLSRHPGIEEDASLAKGEKTALFFTPGGEKSGEICFVHVGKQMGGKRKDFLLFLGKRKEKRKRSSPLPYIKTGRKKGGRDDSSINLVIFHAKEGEKKRSLIAKKGERGRGVSCDRFCREKKKEETRAREDKGRGGGAECPTILYART